LNLNLSFTGNFKTNRYELVARASGNNASESQRAIGWIKTVLQNPNWRAENLPRIRDVVDQQLMSLRRVMQDSEENWVNNPAGAYMAQSNPVHLAALSSLTRMHNAQRLRWMLKDAGNAENQATISAFLTKLAQAEGNRENLKTLLGAMQGSKEQAEKVSSSQKSLLEDLARLPNEARHLATEAVKDLDQTISDVPDSSLAADWAYLCHQMRKDLLQSPETTLANLDGTRRKLLSSPNARMFVIGSRETQAKLEPSYQNLLAGFDKTSIARINYSKNRRIDERVKARDNTAENPIFVGLMAPNMTGGVFINEVPFVSYTDTDREKLLDYLASKLYAGSGGHSVFAITIGAGLAYSNGVSSNPSSGLLKYYAERTPELPQTLGYVIGEIKKPFKESSLSEYVIALSFGSRAALPYEQRGEAMATDLADGTTPEVVSKFRSAILELRKMPNLAEELYRRKDKVYAQILPGYGVNGKPVTSANYFVIGSEKQMSAYENYLKTADGSGAKLYRLYPRDFWLP
jgi:Zn-dependent M16 (insulinase) family peptidase